MLAKGVFDVKRCGESKKVGPNALRCFLFEKSGVFWKNGWLRFVAKNNKTIFFRKVPIWLKVSIVEHWDQLFWIPRIILHQKRSLPTGKNFIFNFFTKKDNITTFVTTTLVDFMVFCTYTQKLGYYPHFSFFHGVLKI